MATIRDVAAQAGVSYTTVSYVLNERDSGRGISAATRLRVQEVARSLNYTPNPHAQNLSNGRSNNTIGLFTLWFGLGTATEKVQKIQSILNERGFDVPLYGIGLHDPSKEEVQVGAIASIRRQKPRALVCFVPGMHQRAIEELLRYQDEGGIVVAYDFPNALDCDTVVFDREDNTYQTARHLMELGHRRIAYGSHSQFSLDDQRVQGFKRAIEEFGGEWHEEWLLEAGDSGSPERGGQILAAKYLALKERPTGICIVNDASALVFMSALQRAGVQCPQQISIVGHDDNVQSQYAFVPLTTVSHPSATIAEHVTQFLFSRLSGEYTGVARQVRVRGEVIVRESATSPSQENI